VPKGSIVKSVSSSDNGPIVVIKNPIISVIGAHFPQDVIFHAVFYIRYGASYYDFEAIMEESGVRDHFTLTRWVARYSPTLALKAKSRKRTAGSSWHADKAYIKVKREWIYLF